MWRTMEIRAGFDGFLFAPFIVLCRAARHASTSEGRTLQIYLTRANRISSGPDVRLHALQPSIPVPTLLEILYAS